MALRKLMSKEGIPLIPLNKGANSFVQEIVQGSPDAVEVILLGTNGEPQNLIEKMEIKPSLREEESLLGRVKVSLGEQGQKTAHSSKVFDPSVDTWLRDHCPTYVIPTMPFTFMLGMMEEMAQALSPDLKIVGFKDVKVSNWLSFGEGFQEVRTDAELLTPKNGSPFVKVTLKRFRKAGKPNLSRFEPFCSGLVLLGSQYRESSEKPRFKNLEKHFTLDGEKLYKEGFRFHGSLFQIIHSMSLHADHRVTTFLDNSHGKDKNEIFRKGFLLDGMAQSVPHEESREWMEKNGGMIGFPYSVKEAQFFGPYPQNPELPCEVEFKGYGDSTRLPRFEIRIYSGKGPEAKLWAKFLWEEVLVSLSGLEGFSPKDKMLFLKKEAPLTQLFFAKPSYSDEITISMSDVKSFDWLHGTVARIYLNDKEFEEYKSLPSEKALSWLTSRIGAKELMSLANKVHPSLVNVQENGEGRFLVSSARRPMNAIPLCYESNGTAYQIRVDGCEFLNTQDVQSYWTQFLHREHSAVETLALAVGTKFCKEFVLEDPVGFKRLKGHSCIYLANHQNFLETFCFGTGMSGLSQIPLIILGKKEHEN
ncbi:MAG: polyketide synthase dehydratase domain-containing protein, partial [bacterium]|nr:polyketide synthase dehydratase domain-containing protein [bacterium]